MSTIKAILFDADGVFISHTNKMFSERIAEELNISIDLVQPFFDDHFESVLTGKEDLATAITPFAKSWGWKGSVTELIEFWFNGERTVDEDLMVYIRKLHENGVTCCVATNNEINRAQFIFEVSGFSEFSDKLYSSSELGATKPNQVFFEKVWKDLGKIPKDQILFWDDSPENVAGGKAFGFMSELYTDFESFKVKMDQYV